jgi:AraC-like DNA-binding protein
MSMNDNYTISGFNEAFKKFFGVSPSVIKENSFELARGFNEERLAVGMAEKAKEFVATHSEIYRGNLPDGRMSIIKENSMHYQIFKPKIELLSEFVKCYWILESPKEKTPAKNIIVPDGCMKLIFHYGDFYKHYPENGNSITLPRCFLIGQLTHPYEVGPTGETGTFFVCFHPNGFLPFTDIPIKEMENSAVTLEKLFGKDGQEIEQKILVATSTLERINLIEKFLLTRLDNKETVDHIVKSTLETILTANGQLSVNELSRKTNFNRRQLERKFSTAIGLSPKQLSKTIRLQATLKTLLNEQVTSLTDLAYENEYYDQAHFIKDFKEFTGLTPKEFYGDDLKMSLIFDNKD